MNTMINFENERRKNPGFGKDKICHNINVKPSLFDRQIQDLNLPHVPYRYDIVGKGKKQQSNNDNNKENTNHCTECNKTYKTPSSLKAHHTKFHKIKKVKDTSLKDNARKGQSDTIVGQSPSLTEESNYIIFNPLQNLSPSLTSKLTDKLLNKNRSITLGRGLDEIKNNLDLNMSAEEFVKSRLS